MFYLAIPQYLQGGMNISLAHGRVSTRYLAQMQLVRDENSGTNERPVQLARKNLRILAEGENLDGSVVLGCARIIKSEAGIYQIDNTYIPPLIDIHAHPNLKRVLSSMIELLVTRSSQVSGSRRQKNQSLADFTASDVANFWLLYTINTHLPGLRHFLDSSNVQPMQLFSELSDFAGALTAFSTKIEPRDLPTYNHEQLGACFGELDRLIRLMWKLAKQFRRPSPQIQPRHHLRRFDRRHLEGLKFYLAISADIRDADLIDRVPKLLKACSAFDIELLIRNALPGLRLRHVPTPRQQSHKVRQQYFAIEQAASTGSLSNARAISPSTPHPTSSTHRWNWSSYSRSRCDSLLHGCSIAMCHPAGFVGGPP